MIASVIRAWVTNNVPEEIQKSADEVLSLYSKEKTSGEIVNYVKGVVERRKNEMESMISVIKSKKN